MGYGICRADIPGKIKSTGYRIFRPKLNRIWNTQIPLKLGLANASVCTLNSSPVHGESEIRRQNFHTDYVAKERCVQCV